MHRSRSLSLPGFRQQSCKLILFICWIAGLLMGMITAAGAGDSLLPTMRGADFVTVSIPGQLLLTVLPFLLTALAVFLSLPWLLFTVVLLKAFTFGYCVCVVTMAFCGASWLACFLLMFSDGCVLPLLMWLWLCCCDRMEKCSGHKLAAFTAAAVLIGILDICMISPFAVTLL